MPQKNVERWKFPTAVLTCLGLIVGVLISAVAPAHAATAPQPTSVQITGAIAPKTAPPDNLVPYTVKKFDINYSGNGPVTLSGTPDGSGTFRFHDLLFITIAPESPIGGGSTIIRSITPDCKTVLAPLAAQDVGFYAKPGVNHITVSFYNSCGLQQSDPLYLQFSGLSTQPPPVTPPPAFCGSSQFFGVRGSGEHSNFGPTIGALNDELIRAVPNIRTDYIDYAAVDVQPFSQKYPAGYVDSVYEGAAKLEKAINSYLLSCQTKYVILGGYSQGAEVVRKAFADIPEWQKKRVASVVLFGDPQFNPKDDSIDRGDYASRFPGIDIGLYGEKATKTQGVWRNRIQDYCTVGDPVCSYFVPYLGGCTGIFNDVTCPHLQYQQRGWVRASIPGVLANLATLHALS